MGILDRLFGKEPKKEQDEKIGSVKIIWKANEEAATLFTSMGQESGLSMREVVSAILGKDGSLDDLITAGNRTSLSRRRKVWCETTPIYRSKKGRGLYVLFDKVDDATCEKEGLEFIGTIDAKDYTAALCAENGIDGKSVIV